MIANNDSNSDNFVVTSTPPPPPLTSTSSRRFYYKIIKIHYSHLRSYTKLLQFAMITIALYYYKIIKIIPIICHEFLLIIIIIICDYIQNYYNLLLWRLRYILLHNYQNYSHYLSWVFTTSWLIANQTIISNSELLVSTDARVGWVCGGIKVAVVVVV